MAALKMLLVVETEMERVLQRNLLLIRMAVLFSVLRLMKLRIMLDMATQGIMRSLVLLRMAAMTWWELFQLGRELRIME